MKGQDCYCCGARPAHPGSKCPAKDEVCHNCGEDTTYVLQEQESKTQTQPVDENSQPPYQDIIMSRALMTLQASLSSHFG